MADDKGDKKDNQDEKKEDCISAATFDIKVCKHKEKKTEEPPPPKSKSNVLLQVSVTLTVTLGLSLHLTSGGSPSISTQSSVSVSTSSSNLHVKGRLNVPSTSSSIPSAKGSSRTHNPFSSNIPNEILNQYRDLIQGYLLEGPKKGAEGEATGWSDELLDQLSQQTDFLAFLTELSGAIASQDPVFLEQYHSAQNGMVVSDVSNPYGGESRLRPMLLPRDVTTALPEDQLFMVEQAIETGCMPYPTVTLAPSQWLCPFTTSTRLTADVPPLGFIQGDNVNIRESPGLDSPIVGTASYEFVEIHQQTVNAWTTADAANLKSDNIQYKTQTNGIESGWYPIIWNNTLGYVYQPYVLLCSREGMVLVKEDESWSFSLITTQ